VGDVAMWRRAQGRAAGAAVTRRRLQTLQASPAALLPYYEQAAKERQVAAGKQHGRGRKVVQNSAQAIAPKARDLVAAVVNVTR